MRVRYSPSQKRTLLAFIEGCLSEGQTFRKVFRSVRKKFPWYKGTLESTLYNFWVRLKEEAKKQRTIEIQFQRRRLKSLRSPCCIQDVKNLPHLILTKNTPQTQKPVPVVQPAKVDILQELIKSAEKLNVQMLNELPLIMVNAMKEAAKNNKQIFNQIKDQAADVAMQLDGIDSLIASLKKLSGLLR